jgi:MFS-type transporter involved in bile tolerance (Atg22 family)
MDSIPIEIAAALNLEINQTSAPSIVSTIPHSQPKFAKAAIRNSLRASTGDAIFSGVFSLTTSGILLSDFLVRLDASPVAFGMLSSLPMLVNLVQPLGAYLSEGTTSRFHYSLLVYGTSRLLWLILLVGICCETQGILNSPELIQLTLFVVLVSNLAGGLGSASWLSWLAVIVPKKLRGRYFGIRNSAGSLTNLLCIPLAGLVISSFHDNAVQGYGLILAVGIICGLIGLGCQYFK